MYPSSGNTIPILVSAGSMSTHATSPIASAASSASRSLNGTARVVNAGSTCGPIAPGRLTVSPRSLSITSVSSTEPW